MEEDGTGICPVCGGETVKAVQSRDDGEALETTEFCPGGCFVFTRNYEMFVAWFLDEKVAWTEQEGYRPPEYHTALLRSRIDHARVMDEMCPDERAFILSMRANRRDGSLRSVYADWLEERGKDDEALVQRQWTVEKQDAVEWLMGYAAEVMMNYPQLIQVVLDYLKSGDDDSQHYLPFQTPYRVFKDAQKFWEMFALATGRSDLEGKSNVVFRCGC